MQARHLVHRIRIQSGAISFEQRGALKTMRAACGVDQEPIMEVHLPKYLQNMSLKNVSCNLFWPVLLRILLMFGPVTNELSLVIWASGCFEKITICVQLSVGSPNPAIHNDFHTSLFPSALFELTRQSLEVVFKGVIKLTTPQPQVGRVYGQDYDGV